MTILKNTAIEYLRGVGPTKGQLLRKHLKIHTLYDLLFYFPFRYVDRTKFTPIQQITEEGVYVQCLGKIMNIRQVLINNKKKYRLVADFTDGTGTIELTWFQGYDWVFEKIKIGQIYVVFGRVAIYSNNILSIAHPEIELYEQFLKKPFNECLQPIYSTTETLRNKGLDYKGIATLVKNLLIDYGSKIEETLPQWIIERVQLIDLPAALHAIHFPSDQQALYNARRRLKFEEIFLFQLNMQKIRIDREMHIQGKKMYRVGQIFHSFFRALPYQLTKAQQRVVREIWEDMKSGRQMNRLLQGDVGSGKTLVALMAMLLAVDNNYQACFMAPTEILAQQHFRTLQKFLHHIDIRIALLTGSTKTSERKKLLPAIASGQIHIIVGTHALIEDTVEFHNLGLVVIDEQHRFGVAQRARLQKKSEVPPHVLVMTATPIPRTLALTIHGDLDVSILDEFPTGAKNIKTIHFYDHQRLKMYDLVRKEIDAGRQAYFVYPLIEESPHLDLKPLMDQYDEVVHFFPRPRYSVGILHGRMSANEKEEQMQRFLSGINQILVSTTVIEVGVDVPNATVMVIENAERFGLSQLHQLRGRIGRGGHQSYCILMTPDKLEQNALRRIQTIVNTLDGFRIAEADLQLRGPGLIDGIIQSGHFPFKLIDITTDQKMIDYSSKLVQQLLKEDPLLQSEKNRILTQTLYEWKKEQTFWAHIG